jgi:hypothetical protein
MTYILGHDRSQLLLLPEAVDDYVGADNPVRFFDAFVDGLDLAAASFGRVEPKVTGRPGYAPADLLKLYIYGYLNRVRSSNRSSWRHSRTNSRKTRRKALRLSRLAFFGTNDDPRAVGEAVRRWDGLELEEAANRAGLQATMPCSTTTLIAPDHFGSYGRRAGISLPSSECS